MWLVGLVLLAMAPTPALHTEGRTARMQSAATSTKEATVTQWRRFVGTWQVLAESGEQSETVIAETQPGVFVHRGNDFTVMVGWDAHLRAMHAFGFSTDDRPFEQTWHLEDDQPTFRGELLGTGEEFLWSIVDGVWTMDFGSLGRMTATRIE